LRALLAEVGVVTLVAGACLLGPPDAAAFDPLKEGLEERDAGCDDDEVAFDAVRVGRLVGWTLEA
jgi:hypothetical protein